MATTSAPSISSEQQAYGSVAGRRARAGARLLLVALTLMPVYGSIFGPVGWPARLAIVGMLCVSALRPGDALLLSAALLPITPAIGALLGFPGHLHEPLLLAFLAGWMLHDTLRRQAPGDSAAPLVLLPAYLLAAVVAASGLVQLVANQPFDDFPLRYAGHVLGTLAGGYAFGDMYPGLNAGAAMLEDIGLFVAVVVLCRREPRLARRLVRMAALGGVAVAGLNLVRLAELSLRHPGLFRTLLFDPRYGRISSLYADVNAAASYLAMMLLIAVGFVISRRRALLTWAPAALLILAALWFNLSWTAPPAAFAAAVVVFGCLARRKHRAGLKYFLAGVALLFTALMLIYWYDAGYARHHYFTRSYSDRAEFSLAALRAVRDHPAFGVGIGRFWTASTDYILDPQVRARTPHENAHNNFLQVLAELGCVGFTFFAWMLVVVSRKVLATLRTPADDGVLAGCAAGVLAFLFTCVVSHPLLTVEVASMFWLMLGALVALSAEPAGQMRARPGRAAIGVGLFPVAAILCLVISVPLRVHAYLQDEADLSGASIGFSKWQFDSERTRYHTMRERAQFYIPGAACQMRLLVEIDSGPPAVPAVVETSIDGRAGNRVEAVTGSWREARFVFPYSSARRFRRVDLHAVRGGSTGIRVSRPVLYDCHGDPL